MSLIAYIDCLARIAPTLINVSDDSKTIMNNKAWLQLNDLITQDVLIEAYGQGNTIAGYFRSVELTPIQRPMKSIDRIKTKRNDSRTDNAFKLNSDLMAFRFHVPINQIYSTANKIGQIITDKRGIWFIRNHVVPVINGVPDTTQPLTDITLYMFGYLPNGFLMEIQISHPFASAVFSNDSRIRDMKIRGEDATGMVDFWDTLPTEKLCVYDQIKGFLLSQQNDTQF